MTTDISRRTKAIGACLLTFALHANALAETITVRFTNGRRADVALLILDESTSRAVLSFDRYYPSSGNQLIVMSPVTDLYYIVSLNKVTPASRQLLNNTEAPRGTIPETNIGRGYLDLPTHAPQLRSSSRRVRQFIKQINSHIDDIHINAGRLGIVMLPPRDLTTHELMNHNAYLRGTLSPAAMDAHENAIERTLAVYQNLVRAAHNAEYQLWRIENPLEAEMADIREETRKAQEQARAAEMAAMAAQDAAEEAKRKAEAAMSSAESLRPDGSIVYPPIGRIDSW